MMEFLKKLVGDQKGYRQMMERAKALPEDYQFVFEKIQKFMRNFAARNGYGMLKIHYELIELIEEGAAEDKHTGHPGTAPPDAKNALSQISK